MPLCRLSCGYAFLEDVLVRGIGIDLVSLPEFRRICGDWGAPGQAGAGIANAFVSRTFTAAELAQAAGRHDPCEFLAGRFACKEAVFKAVAPLTSEGFDLRLVETLDALTGQPQVSLAGALAPVLSEAGVTSVLVSITNEEQYVLAQALAQ